MCMKKNVEKPTTASIEINGVLYELTNDPSHGVVRNVRKMQKKIALSIIGKYEGKFTPDIRLDEALQVIFKDNPEEIAEFSDASDEFMIIATISLATNKMWDSETLGMVSQTDVTAAFEKAKEVLGGDATTFL